MVFKLIENRGLTIIELLVVLTLISLVLLIVIPQIKTNDYELLAQSKKLCNDIRKIRIFQMSEGGNYRILLDEKGYMILKGTIQISKVDLKENYKIICSKKEIMFKFNGAPSYGGTTITVLDLETGRYCQITIVPASGRVHMTNVIH
ncbi:pilus assembly FimT family protein [Caloranaerobacter azorensis]|uniref:pilus assembly FimT family protein n=1 Tax=Caloranaerobacter azorensis TaxID=116090 RepID=UPI00054FC9F4|nr:type II secretion system protein [Caloranaerobacter azorensis]